MGSFVRTNLSENTPFSELERFHHCTAMHSQPFLTLWKTRMRIIIDHTVTEVKVACEVSPVSFALSVIGSEQGMPTAHNVKLLY